MSLVLVGKKVSFLTRIALIVPDISPLINASAYNFHLWLIRAVKAPLDSRRRINFCIKNFSYSGWHHYKINKPKSDSFNKTYTYIGFWHEHTLNRFMRFKQLIISKLNLLHNQFVKRAFAQGEYDGNEVESRVDLERLVCFGLGR